MKAEEMMSIRRYYKNAISTEFGNRVIVEIGVIKNLEIDEVVNYILIPVRVDNKTVSWDIHRLTKKCECEVESWKDLDELKERKEE